MFTDKKTNKNNTEPSAKADEEYHVASFVAHAIATEIDEVKKAISDTELAEIHAISPEGKIVFTLEGNSQQAIGKNIDKLRIHTGLLSLSPVYHQYIS